MEVHSEEEESDSEGWDRFTMVHGLPYDLVQDQDLLSTGDEEVAQEEGVTYDDPYQDDPCNVVK